MIIATNYDMVNSCNSLLLLTTRILYRYDGEGKSLWIAVVQYSNECHSMPVVETPVALKVV